MVVSCIDMRNAPMIDDDLPRADRPSAAAATPWALIPTRQSQIVRRAAMNFPLLRSWKSIVEPGRFNRQQRGSATMPYAGRQG
jgi:hypothetical protein